MGEPKAFASLSSGLLARKGGARPAMRPQGFGGQIGASLEDLGWDDMGFDPPKPANLPERDAEHDAFGVEVPEQPLRNPLAALTPIGQSSSPVHDQRAELAEAFDAVEAEGDEDYDETAELYEGDAPDLGDVVPMLARKPVVVTTPAVAATAVVAPVVAATPRRESKPRAAAGSKAKTAFTLRLDRERQAAPGLRGDRSIGPTARYRRTRSAARRHARTRWDGRTCAVCGQQGTHLSEGNL